MTKVRIVTLFIRHYGHSDQQQHEFMVLDDHALVLDDNMNNHYGSAGNGFRNFT